VTDRETNGQTDGRGAAKESRIISGKSAFTHNVNHPNSAIINKQTSLNALQTQSEHKLIYSKSIKG